MTRYDNLIVGGGLAGGMIAQEFREVGGEGSIAIIGHEPHTPYHRPPLTKEFLRGEKPAEEVAMHVLSQARASEIRVKASMVLQRLRAGG